MLLKGTLMIVSLLPAGLLFTAWGGLVPPSFRAHSIHFQPSNLVLFGVLLGFWFWPIAVSELRKKNWYFIALAASAATILFVPFQPTWSDNQGAGLAPGLIMHLTELSSHLLSFAPYLLRLILFFMGLMVLVAFLSQWKLLTAADHKALAIVGFGLAVISFSVLIGEKHYLFLFPFLLLVGVRSIYGHRGLAAAWLMTSGPLALVYYLYWLLFKNV